MGETIRDLVLILFKVATGVALGSERVPSNRHRMRGYPTRPFDIAIDEKIVVDFACRVELDQPSHLQALPTFRSPVEPEMAWVAVCVLSTHTILSYHPVCIFSDPSKEI